MEFNWMGRKSKAAAHGRDFDYEVMVSVTKNRKGENKEEWERHRLNFYFSSIAFDHLLSEGYTHVMHTVVAGNSNRMYFKFVKSEDGGAVSGIKLSHDAPGKKFIASFSFYSKTEYEVISAKWQKYYDLKYDKEENFFYIDVENPKIESSRRWVR